MSVSTESGLNIVYVLNGASDLNEGTGVDASLALHLPGPVLPLTFIGMGILLYRSGVAPRWSGLALVAGGVLFPMSRIGEIAALAPISDVLVLAGLAPLAVRLLRGGPATR